MTLKSIDWANLEINHQRYDGVVQYFIDSLHLVIKAGATSECLERSASQDSVTEAPLMAMQTPAYAFRYENNLISTIRLSGRTFGSVSLGILNCLNERHIESA